jgi:hypothetical protein
MIFNVGDEITVGGERMVVTALNAPPQMTSEDTDITLGNGHRIRVRRQRGPVYSAGTWRDRARSFGKTTNNLWAFSRAMTEQRLSSLRNVPASVMGVRA